MRSSPRCRDPLRAGSESLPPVQGSASTRRLPRPARRPRTQGARFPRSSSGTPLDPRVVAQAPRGSSVRAGTRPPQFRGRSGTGAPSSNRAAAEGRGRTRAIARHRRPRDRCGGWGLLASAPPRVEFGIAAASQSTGGLRSRVPGGTVVVGPRASVLLRQTHGFEGFRSLLIEPPADNEAVVQRCNRNAMRLDRDSVPAAEVGSIRYDNVVAELDELVRRDGDAIEHLEEGGPEAPAFRPPGVDARLAPSGPRPIELGTGVHITPRRVEVTPVERVDDPPDDLHVLLRHRPTPRDRPLRGLWRARGTTSRTRSRPRELSTTSRFGPRVRRCHLSAAPEWSRSPPPDPCLRRTVPAPR